MLALVLGAAVAFVISVSQAFLILDASPSESQFRGIHEANGVLLPVGFILAAVAWVASWLPRLSRRTQVRLLWACVALLVVTAIACIGWAQFRYRTAPEVLLQHNWIQTT